VPKILTPAAQAAVRKIQPVFRRFLPQFGYRGVILGIAHRLGRGRGSSMGALPAQG
jgi:hypothetical protein